MGTVISVHRWGPSMLAGPEEHPLVFLILGLQTAVHLQARKPKLRELISSGSHQAGFQPRGFSLQILGFYTMPCSADKRLEIMKLTPTSGRAQTQARTLGSLL